MKRNGLPKEWLDKHPLMPVLHKRLLALYRGGRKLSMRDTVEVTIIMNAAMSLLALPMWTKEKL